MSQTKFVSVKVANLRKLGYSDLEQWLSSSNNVYVGRNGRIWITTKVFDGKGKLVSTDKKIFVYKGSEWANKFKVTKQEPAKVCVEKYRVWLIESGMIDRINELKGLNLGCFCDQDTDYCHAKLLAELLNK